MGIPDCDWEKGGKLLSHHAGGELKWSILGEGTRKQGSWVDRPLLRSEVEALFQESVPFFRYKERRSIEETGT